MKNHSLPLPLFHLHISSLPDYLEELHTLLNEINLDFDMIVIAESRIRQYSKPLDNSTLPVCKHQKAIHN